MSRTQIGSGAVWEEIVGYSRAVRVGNRIEVAGTTAIENDQVVAPGDPAGQTRFILKKIESVLQHLDASLEHVVRTRMYVTDISVWEDIGRVHGEFFSEIRPASTMVEVSKLIRPELVVEIEAYAFVEA